MRVSTKADAQLIQYRLKMDVYFSGYLEIII